MEELMRKLEEIENLILDQNLLQKKVLNMEETSHYLGLSVSHLYKLTSVDAIPFYKPNGKKLYFNREELDSWLLRNRNTTREEIEAMAVDYVRKNPLKF